MSATYVEYGEVTAVITVLIIGALLFLSPGIERNTMSVVSLLKAFEAGRGAGTDGEGCPSLVFHR